MKAIRVALVAVVLTCGADVAHAQLTTAAAIREDLAGELIDDKVPFSMTRGLDYIGTLGNRSGMLLRLLQKYEDERADKQLGATSSASGTTTLVSKGTVPKILGLAVENGAVARSQSGTTVTFRSNLGGAARALAGKGYLQLTPIDDAAMGLLSRLAVSASFDTSRGTAEGEDPTFTGDEQQLSQWTARLQIVNHRDPQSKGALGRWSQRLGSALDVANATDKTLATALDSDPAIVLWIKETAAAVEFVRSRDASKTIAEQKASVAQALKEAEAKFPSAAAMQAGTRTALDAYDRSAADFQLRRDALLDEIKGGALVTLEYTNDRPLKAPRTSNIRLVGELGGAVDVTGNAAVTLYETIPAGLTKRVRDYQASGQIDLTLGSSETSGAFVLSFSGKLTRQLEDTVSDTGAILPNTKGSTGIGQIKLMIPTKASGIKVPFSLTFANRNELIKEKKMLRANVGVTYDLDAVFARFKP
jgi:hypothetical protein